MRTAILTGPFLKPQETQVKFHVENLFGGDTVVVAEKVLAGAPIDRPVFDISAVRGNGPSVAEAVVSLARYRTIRVPGGALRRNLEAFLTSNGIEAVLAEFGQISTRVAPVAFDMGIPVFTYFRGADASAHLRNFLRVSAYRRTIPKLDGVFAVSQSLLDNLASKGVRNSESLVIPSGVDTSRFRPEPKLARRCIVIGRLIEKKRPDVTIRAFARATEGMPDAHLDIFGDGRLRQKCVELVGSLGLSERITFHGAQPHHVVCEYLQRASVFLQHSVTAPNGATEGTPMSVQEALSCGTVIVSTRHAGIPEVVVEGETGFLVEENDEIAFGDRIYAALNLPEAKVAKMSARAREFAVANLDNHTLVRRLEEHMVRLAEASRRRRMA